MTCQIGHLESHLNRLCLKFICKIVFFDTFHVLLDTFQTKKKKNYLVNKINGLCLKYICKIVFLDTFYKPKKTILQTNFEDRPFYKPHFQNVYFTPISL